MSGALASLRRGDDPVAALSALDRYDQLYPQGLFAVEARRARLEALVAVGDHRAALALLDDGRSFGDPFPPDLRPLRADLRAEAGRCDDALVDFDAVVDHAPSGEALERAMYGRAICWGKTGQDRRAREELARYLERFPRGKFSPEAARLLDEVGRNNSP